MSGRKLIFILLSLVLVFGLSLSLSCAKPAPTPTPAPAPAPKPSPPPSPAVAWPKAIRITTPAIGGALYVYGATVAGIIEKNTKVIVTPQPTTGGMEAAELFAKGEADMVATDGYSTLALYAGKPNYTKVTDKMRGFSGAYKAAVHFIVRADSKIYTIADLKGKRAMFIRPAFPLWIDVYTAAFKAYGMTEKDVTMMPALAYREAAQALKEGTADATLQYAAPPSPEFAELARTVPIRILPIPADKQAQILKDVPYEYIGIIKGGTYNGTPDDTPTLYIDSWISLAKQLPDDLAYAAIKAVVENIADLQAAHAMFKVWQPKDLAANPIIPYHSGALKYYKEKGLLASEAEKKHSDMLKEMNQPR